MRTGDGVLGATDAGAWICAGDVPGATDCSVGEVGAETGVVERKTVEVAAPGAFGNDWRGSTSSVGEIGVPGLVASTLGATLRSASTDAVPGRGDVPGPTVS